MAGLTVVPAPGDLLQPAAAWLKTEIRSAVTERGTCALALSGGHTPEPVYRELAADTEIDWSKVELFFGDERAVPADHPESNYDMVSRALLSSLPRPPARVHRMEAERPDLEQAAREYERCLPKHLDVLVLGMGADGHTASLFPGSHALDERGRLVLPVFGPKPPNRRLTITPPVIEAARQIAVLATGGDKAKAAALALEGEWGPRQVPAQLARRGHWFLDRAAATELIARSAAG